MTTQKKGCVLVHVNIPDNIIGEIDYDISQGLYHDRTDAVLRHIKASFDIKKKMDRLEDPDFVKQIRDNWHLKRIDDMVNSIPEAQRRYLVMWLENLSGDEELARRIPNRVS